MQISALLFYLTQRFLFPQMSTMHALTVNWVPTMGFFTNHLKQNTINFFKLPFTRDSTYLSDMAICSSMAEPVFVFQFPDMEVLLQGGKHYKDSQVVSHSHYQMTLFSHESSSSIGTFVLAGSLWQNIWTVRGSESILRNTLYWRYKEWLWNFCSPFIYLRFY